MGHFLAVTGFRTASIDEVKTAITDYLAAQAVQCEVLPVTLQIDHNRDGQLYASVEGWTVVLWPRYFNLHDFPLTRAIAETRNWLVSSIHVYDDEYWEHLCCFGSTELHAFCSRPGFWESESPDDFQRVMAYHTEPTRLASVLGVPVQAIRPYLVDVDTLTDPQAKAHQDDEFVLSEFWVFTDFWRSTGIAYPNPPENLAAVLRLAKDFDTKLPVD